MSLELRQDTTELQRAVRMDNQRGDLVEQVQALQNAFRTLSEVVVDEIGTFQLLVPFHSV